MTKDNNTQLDKIHRSGSNTSTNQQPTNTHRKKTNGNTNNKTTHSYTEEHSEGQSQQKRLVRPTKNEALEENITWDIQVPTGS